MRCELLCDIVLLLKINKLMIEKEKPNRKRLLPEQIAAVISAKIENPNLSSRELERETGVDHTTVSRIVKREVKHLATKSEVVNALVDLNMDIVNVSKAKLLEYIHSKEIETWNDAKQVSSIAKEAMEQHNLLTGDPTENIGIIFVDDLA